MLRILHLNDIGREPERQLLKGLVGYANRHGGCALFPVAPSLAESEDGVDEIIRKAKVLKVDAIFGRWAKVDTDKAKKLNIPVFLRTHENYYPDFPMLTGEHDLIGKLAAEFFIDKHFKSLAFFGLGNLLWTRERLAGFEKTVAKFKDVKCSSYLALSPPKEIKKIGKWLCDLPKPVGLVASNDVMGHGISEVCQEFGLKIPQDVSLLGIDDDEFLCNISYPKMSSIHLDFEKQGEELAAAMLDMASRKVVYPARIPIRATGITERESTLRHNISDRYVREIVEHIDKNFATIIDLDELLSSIPLTRRAVEKRFKREMAPHTIYSYLNYVRVQNMCILLRSTDHPITRIAEECGFLDVLNVGRIFRKYMGLSPRDYRKKFA